MRGGEALGDGTEKNAVVSDSEEWGREEKESEVVQGLYRDVELDVEIEKNVVREVGERRWRHRVG